MFSCMNNKSDSRDGMHRCTVLYFDQKSFALPVLTKGHTFRSHSEQLALSYLQYAIVLQCNLPMMAENWK